MEKEDNSSFLKKLFEPLTTSKAVTIIIVVGIIVYFNALFGQFVWDDDFLIVNNSLVHSLVGVWSYFTPAPYTHLASYSPEGFYRPLTMAYFSLVYQFFHNPFGFHLVQIFMHIVNTILVFILFRKFLREKIAFFLSIIFLVHPMSTEAVAYISATQDVLSFGFGLLALLVLTQSNFSIRKVLLASSLLLLALLTRESGMAFVAFIFIYGLLFNRKYLSKYVLALMGSVFFYTILRIFIGKVFYFSQVISPIMQQPLGIRLLNIPKILQFYIGTFFFPWKLSTARVWVVMLPSFNNFYLPLIVIIALASMLVLFIITVWKRRDKNIGPLIFFVLWLVLGLALFLQIIPLDLMVAERWFYTPMVGLLGIAGLVVEHFKQLKTILRFIILGLVVVILTLLSARTIMRNFDWYSKWTLYSHDIKISPESFILQTNLGVELIKSGDLEEAKKHFEQSIKLAPYNFVNYANLGVLYTSQKNYSAAADYYRKSIAENKYNYAAYRNYALMYLSLKDWRKAEAVIQESLRFFPQSSELWIFLAEAEYKTGNKDAAIEASQRAYQLMPNSYTEYMYTRLKQNLPIGD